MFSTVGVGCSVKWRVSLSTARESFEYRGGGVLCKLKGILSTVREYFEYHWGGVLCKVEGNLDYSAGIF